MTKKKSTPFVTVLMSCYNGGRWLSEAIESVLAQTFNDFEFILVDDCSTDDTLNICRAYQEKDKRIIVIAKQHTGLADSLNWGVSKAKGAWIARLDQDDIAEPSRLQKQINFVHSHPDVVLLGTGFIEINEKGNVIKRHVYPAGHDGLVWRLERLQGFFPHSSVLYRADVIREIGGYNRRIRLADDWRLWLDLSLRGKIACLPDALVRVRRHGQQMSRDDRGFRQFCDARVSTICHFLCKAGRKDPSRSPSEKEWISFLNWAETRIVQYGDFEKRKAWERARAEYFAASNRWAGLLIFSKCLLQSGYPGPLILEKFFGTTISKRLAQEWKNETDAA